MRRGRKATGFAKLGYKNRASSNPHDHAKGGSIKRWFEPIPMEPEQVEQMRDLLAQAVVAGDSAATTIAAGLKQFPKRIQNDFQRRVKDQRKSARNGAS